MHSAVAMSEILLSFLILRQNLLRFQVLATLHEGTHFILALIYVVSSLIFYISVRRGPYFSVEISKVATGRICSSFV
jgi:hypothetical protein